MVNEEKAKRATVRAKNKNDRRRRQQERILKISGRLFREKGYLGTSIDDIAKAANINKASIYYYFKNKNQILYEIAVSMLEMLSSLAVPVVNSDLEPEEKLSQLITNHMKVELSNPGRAGIGQQERRNLTPVLMRSFISLRDEYESLFQQVINEIIAKNKLQIEDSKLITMLILGMMNSITQWYKSSGRLSVEEITNQVIDFIFKAVLVRKIGT